MDRLIPFGRLLGLILILDAGLLLSILGRTTLNRIDEGQIAEVSREMATGHDWVTPRVGGIPWTAYPPLQYWMIGASGSLLGFNEFSVRLPTAMAAIALVAVVACMTRRLAGPAAGLAAAMCMATLPSYFVQSSCCRADVLTMCFSTAAFDRFLAWAERGRRIRDLAAMFGLVSLGFLTKGPLAVAILGLGGLSWFLLRRQWRLLLEMKFWIGIPALLLVVVPWYWAVYRVNGWDFIHDNLIMENLNAYSQGFQQKRPWYFYFKESPLLLPWLLALVFSRRICGTGGLDLALTWFGGVVLFLTLSSAKRINYMTYFCPPLAVAAGIILANLCSDSPGLLRRGLFWFSGTLALGAVGAALVPPEAWTGGDIQKIALRLPLIAAGLVISCGIIAGINWRYGPGPGSIAAAALLAAGYFVYGSIVNPDLSPENRMAADFCRRAAARIPAGQPLFVPAPEGADGLLHFYAGRTMPLRKGEPGYYIANQAQRNRMESDGKAVQIIDSVLDQRGQYRYLLRVLQ